MIKISRITLMISILLSLLTACQPIATPTALPTSTPRPTPTITPTPAPQSLSIGDFIENCQNLDQMDIPVILKGRVYLPLETIYGYEGWLGINLISTDKTRVLIQVGEGENKMVPLPTLFTEKDLFVRAFDGREIRNGHHVVITGHAKYRDDNPDRRCEVYADRIESDEPDEALIPIRLKIFELLNNDRINDCADFGKTNQLIELRGGIVLDDYYTNCWGGKCLTPFNDGTGRIEAIFSTTGGTNTILPLIKPFLYAGLSITDQDGNLVDYDDLIITGVVSPGEAANLCEIQVYEISPPE